MPTPKLAEIASRILVHLRRFEAGKAKKTVSESKRGRTRFCSVDAWPAGSKVGVRYISYQGDSHLTKVDALAYLAWLDAGNVGKHWEALAAKVKS